MRAARAGVPCGRGLGGGATASGLEGFLCETSGGGGKLPEVADRGVELIAHFGSDEEVAEDVGELCGWALNGSGAEEWGGGGGASVGGHGEYEACSKVEEGVGKGASMAEWLPGEDEFVVRAKVGLGKNECAKVVGQSVSFDVLIAGASNVDQFGGGKGLGEELLGSVDCCCFEREVSNVDQLGGGEGFGELLGSVHCCVF